MKYADRMKEETIYIHHALENDQNIVKMSAYRRVNSFDTVVNSISQSIPTESVDMALQSAFHEVLSGGTITQLCYGIFLQDRGVDVGTIENASYSCYSKFRVSRLKHQLALQTLNETVKALGSKICWAILRHIEFNIEIKLRQTFENLRLKISDELSEQISVVVMTAITTTLNIDSHLDIPHFVFTLLMMYLWPVDVNSRDWRSEVAHEIYEIINKSKADIFREIKTMCKQTVQELQVVSNTTAGFKRSIGQPDQTECK